jgi:hypothetical protein
MDPAWPMSVPRVAALLAIALGALSIMVGAYQGKVMTVGQISVVVIVVALISLRRLAR